MANVFSESELWDKDQAEDAVTKVVEAAPAQLGLDLSHHEINFVLVNDDFIQAYNKTYRNMDKPTNVLSFPYEADEHEPDTDVTMLGDVYLAFETIEREAKEQNKPFWNHFTHLAIHGFLHQLGYDHQTDTEAEEMEALEVKILKTLQIPDPYHEEAC